MPSILHLRRFIHPGETVRGALVVGTGLALCLAGPILTL